jgi:hypothetical protein
MNPTQIVTFSWQILPPKMSQQMSSLQTLVTKTILTAMQDAKGIALVRKEEQMRGNASITKPNTIYKRSLNAPFNKDFIPQWPT